MLSKKYILAALILIAITLSLISIEPVFAQEKNLRQNHRAITLTQQGWCNHAQDLIFNSWRYAFENFSFYGRVRRGCLYVGGTRTICFEGTTAALKRLVSFFPQTGKSGCLKMNYINPAGKTEAGALAGETVALTMNIAYNDERCMPRFPGYDLEKFTLTQGPFRGYTVGRVLDIANRVLGGINPRVYGLQNYEALTDILKAINSNYEFINYATFINRGYLNPDRPLGLLFPPHHPHVP